MARIGFEFNAHVTHRLSLDTAEFVGQGQEARRTIILGMLRAQDPTAFWDDDDVALAVEAVGPNAEES